MSDTTIDTLLYFLSKVYVPPAQQDEFLRAVTALETLKNKGQRTVLLAG